MLPRRFNVKRSCCAVCDIACLFTWSRVITANRGRQPRQLVLTRPSWLPPVHLVGQTIDEGVGHYKQGHWDVAADWSRKAIKADPNLLKPTMTWPSHSTKWETRGRHRVLQRGGGIAPTIPPSRFTDSRSTSERKDLADWRAEQMRSFSTLVEALERAGVLSSFQIPIRTRLTTRRNTSA